MKKIIYTGTIVAIVLQSACNQSGQKSTETADTISQDSSISFNSKIEGKEVNLYTLTNNKNAKASITNYGARLVSLLVPNKEGKLTDVVLGYDNAQTYKENKTSYFGAIVGRYGNRIAKGKFTLDGKTYQLEQNDGENSLHGGNNGIYDKVWDAKQVNDKTLKLTYHSPDGEAGYPGNVAIAVTYTLTDDNELAIDYTATTDKETVLNLTNHAYFNLNGEGDATILDHELTIHANEITPVDETLIPTGDLLDVTKTPFDFRKATVIGARIEADDQQLKRGKGYDHNFVLNKKEGLQSAAVVYSPKTGIQMDVLTEEPGIQFYSGNFMEGGKNIGKGGKDYGHRSAFCLETQHFPDSPNQPTFPSTVLKPSDTYKTKTVYKFLVK
ncbi:aldose epimerase family protein [Olivibacter domesticus]|uniref:Aldose 1-epimerase n=1 Tax=Olivibacter domesticus TaxID=407022 RepID=A0A1H7TNN2_OLID1|nr:aldose epimerase family protein [Olivibacter domesticus]SEL86450.1 aldose 1-epimerase [Olivibacter domesticus]